MMLTRGSDRKSISEIQTNVKHKRICTGLDLFNRFDRCYES